LEHLDREWRLLLATENLPYIHMKEFAHSTGPFESWKGDEPRRRELVCRMVGIIARRVRISIGIVIDRAGYASARTESEIFSGFYVNEYTAAGFMSLLRTSTWAEERGVDGRIAFVFDKGNPKRKDFQKAFDLADQTPLTAEYRMGCLTFGDDIEITPLQAADFIAYEVCKFCTDAANQKKRVRGSLKSLMKAVPSDWKVASPDMLLKLAAEANTL
jgi:hypothetical protein